MADKKPRLVILISSGILASVVADQELKVEVLKVDVDEESEYPVIFRLHDIEVNPQAVEDSFRGAERFWSKQKRNIEQAGESEN